jgi:hypothetical protein
VLLSCEVDRRQPLHQALVLLQFLRVPLQALRVSDSGEIVLNGTNDILYFKYVALDSLRELTFIVLIYV